MLRFIVMTCGYAESAMVAPLIYQCDFFGKPGYTSYQEAITDLALDLYAKFYDDKTMSSRIARKQCCLLTLVGNDKAKFCFECGHELIDKEFDYEEFMNYVAQLHNTTADNYGEAEETITREFTWCPFWNSDFIGAPKEEIIYIAENAEVVLLAALLDAKSELVERAGREFISENWEMFKAGKQSTYR